MIAELMPESLWLRLIMQMTLCLAAGLSASFLLRQRAARAHQVLLTALLASVLTPGVYAAVSHLRLGILPSERIPPPGQALEPVLLLDATAARVSAHEVADEPVPVIAEQEQTTTAPLPWDRIALGGWISLSVILLGRLGVQFALGTQLVTAARAIEGGPFRGAVESAKTRLRIAGPIRIRCSERIKSPIIWCWTRRPVLLVHAAAEEQQDAEWMGVFCHELAHLKRRDHLSGLFVEILTALLPWHPLLWWARAHLARLSEQACDDWVLAAGHSGVDYAETLLGLAAQRQMAFVPTVIGKEKTMKARIHRIIKDQCADPRLGAKWTAGVGILALLAVVSVGFAQRRPAAPSEQLEPPQPPEAVVQPAPEGLREAMPDPRREIVGQRLRELLEEKLHETAAQIEEQEARVRAMGDAPALERQAQEFELDLLREKAVWIERRLRGLETPKSARLTEDAVREHRLAVLRVELVRLAQVRERTERAFENLKGGEDAKSNELQSQLRQLEARSRELEAAIADTERARAQPEPEGASPNQGPEVRARHRATAPDPYGGMYGGAYDGTPRERAVEPTDPTRRRASTRDGASRLETRVYAMQQPGSERVPAIMEALIEPPETATVFADGAKVAVSAARERHLQIERIIRIIDVPAEEIAPDLAEGGETEAVRLFRLQYSDPKRMHAALRAVLGRAGGVEVDGRTLVIRTAQANMKRVESIVRELDVPPVDPDRQADPYYGRATELRRVPSTGPRARTEAESRPELEAQVEDLRSQMQQLQERMQQMQRRLEQVDER